MLKIIYLSTGLFSVESVFTHIRYKSTDNFSNSVLQSGFFMAERLFFIYKCLFFGKMGVLRRIIAVFSALRCRNSSEGKETPEKRGLL